MHSYSLVHYLPWLNGSAPPHSREAAIACITAILDEIAKDKREPDAWEAQDLMCAIMFIAAGVYPTGLAYARRALTPSDERLELYPIPMPKTGTIELLRNLLRDVEAEDLTERSSGGFSAVAAK